LADADGYRPDDIGIKRRAPIGQAKSENTARVENLKITVAASKRLVNTISNRPADLRLSGIKPAWPIATVCDMESAFK